MTSRNGGRIPPDGRTPQAPGIGRNAKRHDLERPKTPGLHDSDLQQGDVQMLEQGQRIQGIKQTQQPALSRPRTGRQPQRSQTGLPAARRDSGAPEPLEFLRGRLAGSMPASGPSGGSQPARLSNVSWGFLNRMSALSGTSGLVAQAYMNAVRTNNQYRPPIQAATIDLNEMDQLVQDFLEA